MNLADTDYDTLLYLDALWRRRFIFLLAIIITPILAVLSTYLLPQKYIASTSIAINANTLPAMKDITSPIDMTEQFQTLKAFITSPSTLQKIAIESGLAKAANKNEVLNTGDMLLKGLNLTLLEKSVIEIKLIQTKPNHMVDVLNIVSRMMIQRLNSQESNSTQASLTVLSQTLEKQKLKLKESIEALSKYETTHNDLLPEYSEIYQARLRAISNGLGEKQAQLTSIKAQKQELEDSLVKINPVIVQLDRAILDNALKLSKLRLLYTENYPAIKALLQLDSSIKTERAKIQKQIQALDKDKIQDLWNLSISQSSSGTNEKGSSQIITTQLEKLLDMQLRFKGMQQEIANLNEQQQNLNKKLQFITDNKQAFMELKQTIKDNQTAYQDVLARTNLAKMSAGLTKDDKSNNVKVVSYPENPTSSLSKPISFFLFLGLIAGIILGISIPIILELIDNTARNKRAIETATGFDVICRVERMRFE